MKETKKTDRRIQEALNRGSHLKEAIEKIKADMQTFFDRNKHFIEGNEYLRVENTK